MEVALERAVWPRGKDPQQERAGEDKAGLCKVFSSRPSSLNFALRRWAAGRVPE